MIEIGFVPVRVPVQPMYHALVLMLRADAFLATINLGSVGSREWRNVARGNDGGDLLFFED